MYRPRKAGEARRWVELKGNWQRDLHEAKLGYNFTIRASRGVLPFSTIRESDKRPVLTPLGNLVKQNFIRSLSLATSDAIWIKSFVIMPDHLHCCVWVEKPIRQTINQYFTKALLFAQKEAEREFQLHELWQLPGDLFMCYSWEVFQQKIAYNEANVDRWKMDHFHRELSHPHILSSHPLLTSPYQWQGFGHVSLLDEPNFLPCYVSSKTSGENLEKFTRLAVELAKEGWVLIGGFVSENERSLLRNVREKVSVKVIHVAATRLLDEKVPAQLAKSLSRGLFLRLTSAEGQETCTRDLCVWHNLWVDSICQGWRDRVVNLFKNRGISLSQEASLKRFLFMWQSPRPARYRGARELPG